MEGVWCRGHTTGHRGDTELLLSVPPAQGFPIVCPGNCCSQSSRKAPAQISCKSKNSEVEGCCAISYSPEPISCFPVPCGQQLQIPT